MCTERRVGNRDDWTATAGDKRALVYSVQGWNELMRNPT